MRTPLALALVLAMPVLAAPVKKPLSWTIDKEKFKGVVVYDDATKAPRPGFVMVPNWLGVTDAAVKQAVEFAGQKHVILVADV